MSVAIRGNVRIGGKVLANTTIGDYVAATGATDTTVLANLTAYLKLQNLWASVRFFPFKSAQNKGSGTTVYGLGGWTSNNVTLVNGPTWGAAGVAFDATDDRATWDGTGIESLSELFVFDRQITSADSLANTQRFGRFWIGDLATLRFFTAFGHAGALSGETASIGLTNAGGDRRLGQSNLTWTAGTSTRLIVRFAQTGSAMWKSKTAGTMNLTSGTNDYRPSESGWTTDSIVNINATRNGAVYIDFFATTRVALLFCKTSLTQAQRETITDYLDAL